MAQSAEALPSIATRTTVHRSWWQRNGRAFLDHLFIWFFLVIIILPLTWVLVMSVKSLPDAMRGSFWPRRFDFSHYEYVFTKIEMCRAHFERVGLGADYVTRFIR